MGGALAGLALLRRPARLVDAWILAAPILYVTAVHLPLLTEARQSLPAKPVVLLLATIGVVHLRGHSLALKPQVHERQHL